MKNSPNLNRLIPVRPDKVAAEEWMQTIRSEESQALSALHKKLIQRMEKEGGACISSTLDLPDPETDEQEDIVEDEATYRIEFKDGSAIVLGVEPWGYTIRLGVHSSRLPPGDPFQGFRYVDREGDLYGQHLPQEAIN